MFAGSCILLSLTLRVCHAELGWQARDGALTAQVHLAQLKPDGSLAGIPEGAQVVLASDSKRYGRVVKRDGQKVRVDFSASGGRKSASLT